LGVLSKSSLIYQTGSWEIDPGRRELRLRGAAAPIGSRAFEIIEKLAESAGQLVTKDALLAHVWPGITVEENTLQVHIAAIRRALGPDRGMLKTASGRGYRLLGGWRIGETGTANRRIVGKQVLTFEGPPTNLSARNTSLIGRNDASKLLRDRLTAYRVVTLIGSGGIGKTSLATEVARGVRDDFAHGVWLVDLAAFQDPKLVASAVAGTLGLKLSSETVSPEAVARAIGNSERLLVLDNCEHVVEAAARFAEAVVQHCPNVTVLATSREMLWIAGECIYRVPPLDVPAMDQEEPGRLLKRSSVELFVTRTQALDSDFSPSEDNAQAIAAICRHLDGIPLAIELAAARAATLGVRQVAAGLSDRFTLLTSRRRTALSRHQTLRASLDWSYKLLSDQEQRLLRHLAIFAGDFSLDAVFAVTKANETNLNDATDNVANLVSKSLVIFDGTTTPNRWRLLETIRAYAFIELREAGEHSATLRRHAEYYRDLIVSLSAGSKVQLSAENVARCGRELDNVRSALDWAFSPGGDTAIGAALTAAFAPIWTHLSLYGECCERVGRLLTLGTPAVRLGSELQRAMYSAYAIALNLILAPVERIRAVVETVRQLADGTEDIELRMQSLWYQWAMEMNCGDYGTALSTVRQLNELAKGATDDAARLMAERCLGNALLYAGELNVARERLQHAADHYVAPRDGRHATLFHFDQRLMARSKLTRVLWLMGYVDRALVEARRNFEIARAANEGQNMCWVLQDGLCPIALMTGDLMTAEIGFAAMSEWSTRVDAQLWKIMATCWKAKLLIERGEFAQGVTLMRPALDVCERSGWQLWYSEHLGYLAQGLAGLGYLDEARQIIERAITWGDRSGAGWCQAELLRKKGEILLKGAGDTLAPEAEYCFQRARNLARKQSALFWELRVALSHARLRVSQRRHSEAKRMLRPVYDRFSEGFESADLRAARGMLDLSLQ
jgi:predicted ATPase/DNA-binding winged helix-turn-helix (wHTH) protein